MMNMNQDEWMNRMVQIAALSGEQRFQQLNLFRHDVLCLSQRSREELLETIGVRFSRSQAFQVVVRKLNMTMR